MAPGHKAVVWIVDDAESVRKSLAAVLETAAMVVREFPSARAFLSEFDPEEVGCLVVDHHMPDMTGLELLQHLKALGAVPPAIVITGDGDGALKQRVLEAGALAMLNKPVDGDELIVMLEKLTLNAT